MSENRQCVSLGGAGRWCVNRTIDILFLIADPFRAKGSFPSFRRAKPEDLRRK